ncbi:MAG: glutaredoxin family protein [Gammaproteobacteria bacterium]|nr:glutaredoxin family protein [Gammaproteobacteria bacterium]
MGKAFTLYYRENCHLCESMQLALRKLQRQLAFDWDEVDIDRDTDLIRRFDILVPVLYYQDREVCHHFIDEQAIRRLVAD